MKGIYPRVAVLTFTAALSLAGCGRREAAAPSAPPVVLVTEATEADAPVFTEAIATLDGSAHTPIHSQVSGYLIRQAYREGSAVKPGDLLFEIDPRPFHPDSNQAKDDAEAAKLPTAKNGANAGLVRVTSPEAGIAGRALPGEGDWIARGMTLTTVSTVDPMAAAFAVTGKFYLDHPEQLAATSFELVRSDGTPYPQKGKFDHLERPAPTSTGAITAYALFPNPDRALRPGQYAKVRGVTRRIGGAVLIPQRSVTQAQGIDQVRVVKPDNTVEVRNVTTGGLAGSLWIITSGLKPGERVVVEGTRKCQPGATVTPEPYAAPAE
jgi:multidrug efflux pump subunit AcrA (membrane-fusion protein)